MSGKEYRTWSGRSPVPEENFSSFVPYCGGAEDFAVREYQSKDDTIDKAYYFAVV